MEENRKLSLNLFLNTMQESCANEKRYCFILGAGASKTSGIPTGEEMARRWHDELLERNTPEELKQLQKRLGVRSMKPSSKNYFSLYAMRFFPEYKNGSAFLEQTLEGAKPSLGYYPLATLLASTRNNLVLTTNFDSLVEDALFIYTDKRPMVVSHELLVDYLNLNTSRPIVAKLHRGLYFDPLNRADQVSKLSDKWKKALHDAFKLFTPVVIGYAGGDHSLMDFLKDEAQLDGLYWCYRHEEPPAEVQELVDKHQGYFVPIEGFDEMMFLLGRKFGYENPCERIQSVAAGRVEAYNSQVQAFEEKLNAVAAPNETQNQILSALNRQQAQELEQLNRRIQDNPDDRDAYLRRGKLFRNVERFTDALADFTRAGEIREDYEVYYYQGETYTKTKQYAKALEAFTKSLAYKKSGIAYHTRGIVYAFLQEYERGLDDLNNAISLDQHSALAHLNRGRIYFLLKRYEEAIEDYNTALLKEPDAPQAYRLRGAAYSEQMQYDLALADFHRAIQLNPDDAANYNDRGVVYQECKEYKKALSDYNKAVKLSPAGAIYYSNRAEIYLATNRFREALTDCNKAIKIDPKYMDAYKNRADAYEALGQAEKAEQDRQIYQQLQQAAQDKPAPENGVSGAE